jgi:hypothetical protein
MLTSILAGAPARSIDDAVALMTAIDRSLPDTDGVKWFNRLYLRVTEQVRGAVVVDSFSDPEFMAALDVDFANLYFDALARGEPRVEDAPAAWRPLLDCRHRPGIARLQFALAGMNAHNNRDLAAGIVQVFARLGGDPASAEARRRDFDSLNDLLERVQEQVKPEFSTGVIGVIDEIAGRTDDVAAMWKVRKARGAAWTNAEVLWTLQPFPRLRTSFFDKLDGLTGLASRGLLLPDVRP